MDNMNFDRIGDDLAKAYEEGYHKGFEDGYEKGLEEQKLVEHENCDDKGNCIPSTVLESFQEETWEE